MCFENLTDWKITAEVNIYPTTINNINKNLCVRCILFIIITYSNVDQPQKNIFDPIWNFMIFKWIQLFLMSRLSVSVKPASGQNHGRSVKWCSFINECDALVFSQTAHMSHDPWKFCLFSSLTLVCIYNISFANFILHQLIFYSNHNNFCMRMAEIPIVANSELEFKAKLYSLFMKTIYTNRFHIKLEFFVESIGWFKTSGRISSFFAKKLVFSRKI